MSDKSFEKPSIPIPQEYVDAKARLELIRDCFLTGRDREAVAEIQSLRPLVSNNEVYDVLPIQSYGTVAAGQTVQVSARPQTEAFKPACLGISSFCAQSFMVEDIRVGNRSIFVSSGSIAGDLFSSPIPHNFEPRLNHHGYWTCDVSIERVLGVPLNFPVCQIAQDLTLVITNVDGRAMAFRGWFLGKTPRYRELY